MYSSWSKQDVGDCNLKRKWFLQKSVNILTSSACCFPLFKIVTMNSRLVNLPPPPTYPLPRNKGLMRPYQRKPMVNKPLVRTCFSGRTLGGGWVDQPSGFRGISVPDDASICFKHSEEADGRNIGGSWPLNNVVGISTLKKKNALKHEIPDVKEKGDD